MADETLRAEDVHRVVEEVRGHPRREAVGALALDVLSRQAEGRTLFAGKEHVEARAEHHGVKREDADVGGTNLLAVLERGPESARERGLVAAFAVDAFGRRLAEAGDDEAKQLVERFVRHADWLEVGTPYAVYSFVDALLGDGGSAPVWRAVAEAALVDARSGGGPRHDARARNAARLSALASSRSPAAREALVRVASEADDRVVCALARELGGEPADPDGTRLAGRLGPPRRPPARAVLRLVTGVAAFAWLLRLSGRLVGVRRDVEVELVPGGLVVRREFRLLGRTVRRSEERYTMSALAGVGREVRYPMLHLLVGLVALSVGVLAGGLLAFDALRTGETLLLLLAAALVLVGGGLDLALDVLVPAREGRVSVDLTLLPGRSVRLEGVAVDEADRFVEALRRRA